MAGNFIDAPASCLSLDFEVPIDRAWGVVGEKGFKPSVGLIDRPTAWLYKSLEILVNRLSISLKLLFLRSSLFIYNFYLSRDPRSPGAMSAME
jgi:hypothetical protein